MFAVIAVAAVSIAAMLYFSGTMPALQAYFGGTGSTDTDLDPMTATGGDESRSLSEVASLSQSGTGVIQGHLLASISGNKLTIVNEGAIPIRIMRLVRNKFYGVAWCDTDVDVNTDPKKPANFSNRVDRILMLGDSYGGTWPSNCGSGGSIEVQTDRGSIMFTLGH